jgi:prepilin-type N-terminal cleavage/methylation domain-containing protein
LGGSVEAEITKMLSIVPKLYHFRRNSSEQGLTLVECLVAIIIIAIVSAAIAPPILLAAATRLQNQRVEQATQLARGEVDRIRLLVERGKYLTADLPPSSAQNPIRGTVAPNGINGTAPNSINGNASARTSTQGFLIDLNPNRPGDKFVVQTFRAQAQPVNSTIDTPVAFMMGVRVYSSRSFSNSAHPTLTEPPRLGFTSGESLQRPLAVLYTPIVRSDQGSSLCKYHKFINDSLATSCRE